MTAKRRDVLRFFVRGAIFLVPLVVVIGFPIAIILMSGEVASYEWVARRQLNSRTLVLYGPAASAAEGGFKLVSTRMRMPRYLAMGSSRVMSFRSRFFSDSRAFYNSGGAVGGIKHFQLFLDNMPVGHEPKIAIMCFEQRYFNASNAQARSDDYQDWLHQKQDKGRTIIDGVRTMYRRILIEHKYKLAQLFPTPVHDDYTLSQMIGAIRSLDRIGLMAIVNDSGYRNDGSYYYGKIVADPNNPELPDFHFRDTLGRVKRGDLGFQYGNDISSEALAAIPELLDYCKRRGIHVVAFLPPFAPTLLDTMRRTGRYDYIDKIAKEAGPVFREHGVELFDFTDMRTFGSSDFEAIDGWHGGEKAYLRMFIIMAEHDPVLASEVDLPALKQRLAGAADSNYDIFANDDY